MLTVPYDFPSIIMGTALVFSAPATRTVTRRALTIDIADDLKLAE